MGPGDPPRRPLSRFAADVVGLKVDANDGDAPAALFRKLRDDEFLPDPLSHEALLALAGRPVGPGSLLAEEARDAEEGRLLAEIERLAAEFFSIPVASRLERWKALARASARHPRPIGRLKALQPGLSIDRDSLDDPSPAVKRLLDDLLDLFAMPTGARAIESRRRAHLFLSEQAPTEARRARALKDLARRHPDANGLLPDHTARLSTARRPISMARLGAKIHGAMNENVERRPLPYLLFAVVVLGGVTRCTTNNPFSPTDRATPRAFLPPVLPPSPLPTSTKQYAITKLPNRPLRDEIKDIIRRKTNGIGKSLDEPTLDRIADGLPIDELPRVGGMASVVLVGAWTGEVRDRFVDRLKDGLEETGLSLDSRALDDLAAACFPSPAKIPPSLRRKAP